MREDTVMRFGKRLELKCIDVVIKKAVSLEDREEGEGDGTLIEG